MQKCLFENTYGNMKRFSVPRVQFPSCNTSNVTMNQQSLVNTANEN